MKIDNSGMRRMILKIISVFISIVLWLFITYTEDSQMDVTVNSIDVQLTGESYLNEQGFMVVNKSSIPTAAVTVRGKRGDIISVMDSIGAYVDVSGITNEGSYKLRPSFDIPSNAVYISQRKTLNVEVDIEKIENKTVDVRVVQKNSDMNKSYMVESIPTKETVVIRGAHDDIASIDHAAVYIDAAEISQDESVTGTLIYENSEKSEVICINELFTEANEMTVLNKVYEKHEIPVNIVISSEVNKKYSAEVLEQSANTVQVGIKNDEGRKIGSVTNLPFEGELEVGTKDYEFILDVPDGLYIPEDKRTITVKLEVFERTEKLVTVPVRVQNTKNRGYELSKNEISVWLSGPEEKLKSEYITATLNLDEYESSEEEQLVSVTVATDEKDISIGGGAVQLKAKIR